MVLVSIFWILTGCATKQDFDRLEDKVDQLVQATHRSTLEEIFGDQASQITLLLNDLDGKQKQNFENLRHEYTTGTIAVEQVRHEMLNLLGSNDRIVSTRRGIYIRNLKGTKIKAIPNGTNIRRCRLFAREKIPAEIMGKKVLAQYSWGAGELDGVTILFPWELTISSLTKEIAVHTARRTAEEFIKMGGEEKFRRPIRIQVSTEKSSQINVTTDKVSNEVYFDHERENAGREDTLGDGETTDINPTLKETYEVGPWSVE
jgi:hypothetical protein